MQYLNLIWDFDGTLLDTYPHIIAAYQQALAEAGRTADPEELCRKIKISFGEAHAWLHADEALKARFLSYERDIHFAPQATVYDGIPELLSASRKAGCRHFLFTNRNNLALQYMEEAGILSYFEGWVTSEDPEHFEHKPSPKAILYLMEHYGLNPSATAMIGDREMDIESGRAAGIDGIMFDSGLAYPDSRAKIYVKTVAELQKVLLGSSLT